MRNNRTRKGLIAALIAGMALVGWIVGEIALVRADNQLASPIEAVYGIVGLASIWLAARLARAGGALAVDG
jgi:hypothetical protein